MEGWNPSVVYMVAAVTRAELIERAEQEALVERNRPKGKSFRTVLATALIAFAMRIAGV